MVRSNQSNIHKVRYKIIIYGIVQGVGFRPFVYQNAVEYQIKGWVKNAGGAVVIGCSGTDANIENFIKSIRLNPPKLARVEKIKYWVYQSEKRVKNGVRLKTTKLRLDTLNKFRRAFRNSGSEDIESIHCIPNAKVVQNTMITQNTKFIIKKSSNKQDFLRFMSPDIATCPKCLKDIKNKNSYYYGYAFTNCTECGPRYSIIKELPYDRNATTMSSFPMCENCQKEYENPLSRRFHTQSTCCRECGPKLSLYDNRGRQIICCDPIKKTSELLNSGNIVAIKGIGGFHLVCNGKDEKVIRLLRIRKHRFDKPLALMIKNIDIIKDICYVSKKEEEILTSNKRPIVLLNKKTTSLLPDIIAPKQSKLGIMLPYTPLHYLLFESQLDILIMTSGNRSSLPIEYRNEPALIHLNNIADYFLIHNRDIHMPIDDSVVKIVNEDEMVSRIARGYAPYSAKLDSKNEIIAVGGQQKNTICISKGGFTYISQFIGDLEELDCFENFKRVMNHYLKIFCMKDYVYAHDLHPSYQSTKYVISHPERKIPVQHHHAHMVSCMAEHSLHDTVIGVVFDGTGYGLDGAVWGGEFFVGNRCSCRRVGHLEYVTIQGGNQAIKEPWRSAVSYLWAAGYDAKDILQGVDTQKIDGVLVAIQNHINCFWSSSMGRLFDAVAAMTGLRNTITYDGQAAIELENIMNISNEIKADKDFYHCSLKEESDIYSIPYKPIIDGVISDIKRNELLATIAYKFHNTIINASCNLVCKVREKTNINKVILSGGVFENQYLLQSIYNILISKGFKVYYHKQIPTNDSGISFGQIHVANAILREEHLNNNIK